MSTVVRVALAEVASCMDGTCNEKGQLTIGMKGENLDRAGGKMNRKEVHPQITEQSLGGG